MSDAYVPTPRTRPVRKAKRARYDRATVHAILDEALIGALAVVIDGEAHVQPMIHARDGEDLILHGSAANRMLAALETGARACFNVALIDGLLLGRTVPDHSFQYRSVSVYGLARTVEDAAEKRARMRVVFDHIIAKRWENLPPVDEDYLAQVKVMILPLAECVAKVNDAAPEEIPSDAIWSGVIPFAFKSGEPQPAPGPQPPMPAEVFAYARMRGPR